MQSSEIPAEEDYDPRAMRSMIGMEAFSEFDEEWFADTDEEASTSARMEMQFSMGESLLPSSLQPLGPLPDP